MASGALPVIYVFGSNYDIGLQIGKTFRSLIQTAVQIHKNLRNLLLPYYCTNEGDKIYAEYLRVAEEWLPQYMDELRGIAEGSHTPFHHLFLLHLEPEISVLAAKGVPETGGCTSVQLLTDETAVIAHTEDSCPEWKNYGYLVHAHIKPTERNGYSEERYVSFAYPGMLVGNAFSVNNHGFAITGNVVKPGTVFSQGRIARRMLGRAVVAAKSFKDATKIIKRLPGIGGGFHFNMGQKRRGKPSSKPEKVEVVVAPVTEEAESPEEERDEEQKKESDSSDSSSSQSGDESCVDKVEEAEGETDGRHVDVTEEDVRVEMMEGEGCIVEPADENDLDELEEMIQKYLDPSTQTVSRKYVQEVKQIYSYRSSDGSVIEETIYPQVAYPLEAVCKGRYYDDTSSSSDSDSSNDSDGKKRKKKSSNSSKENSDSDDSDKSDAESEDGATGGKNDGSEDGEKGDITEEYVTITKHEGENTSEVITEKRVTVVKTEIKGDINPEEKERLLQDVREKIEKETDAATAQPGMASDEKDNEQSSDSESDSERAEKEPNEEVVEEVVTVTKVDSDGESKEVVTEKRVTVVKTRIVGDIDPEEREKMVQEMKDRMATEREKLLNKRDSGSGGSSDSESDSGKKEDHEPEVMEEPGAMEEPQEEKEPEPLEDEIKESSESEEEKEFEPIQETKNSSESEEEKEADPVQEEEREYSDSEQELEPIKEEKEPSESEAEPETTEVVSEKIVTVTQEVVVNTTVSNNGLEEIEKLRSESSSGSSSDEEASEPKVELKEITEVYEKVTRTDSESDKEKRKENDSSSDSDSEAEPNENDKKEVVDRGEPVETGERQKTESRSGSESDDDNKEEVEKAQQVIVTTTQRRPSESASDAEEKESSSDSSSDSEKEQEENNNEKDEGFSDLQPAIESEEILVVRDATIQQQAPSEEVVESESESESDLSDLEDGETEIRFGSLEVIGVEDKTIIDLQEISGLYCHTNRYLRLDGGMEDDPVYRNSVVREERVKELSGEHEPKTIHDVLSIMGDTSNTRYPIWRNGKFPDFWATMALGVLNFKTEEVMVFRENPKSNPTYAAFQFPK